MAKNEIPVKYQIGKHIKLARKSMQLRQSDLAKMTGLPASHLSEIERGASIPTITTLDKIGDALKRPLEYFFQPIDDLPRSLGMVFHENSIGGRAASKFLELIKEKSGNSINLQIYQRASLGSAQNQIKNLSQGGIHIFIDEPHSFEVYSKLCGQAFLPYFFNDRKHYYKFLKSPIFENQIFQPLLKNGIRVLNTRSYWESGDFELLFSKDPVFIPKDLKGKKMRTYASGTASALRKALGAEPVTVEWEDMYNSFEKGDIDILLCPSSYFSALKFHKIAKYATILRYGYTVNLNVAVSEKEYVKLRPSAQEALLEAAENTGVYCGEFASKLAEEDLKNLSSQYGLPVIKPDDTLWRSAFKKAISSVCSQGFLDKKTYDAIQRL